MFIVKKYKILNKKDLKIAHLSDIHYSLNFNDEKLLKIENKMNKLNPDYICITGDLVDSLTVTEKPEMQFFISFLERLADKYKLLVVIGNHDMRDYSGGGNNKWYEKLNKKIIVLQNSSYEDENIYFYGLFFEEKYYNCEPDNSNLLAEKLKKIKIPKNKYSILLAHSPISFNCDNVALNNNFDLVLSGHTHNGLTPHYIPGKFGFVSPSHGYFLKNARGSFKSGKAKVIISGGITKFSQGTRFRYLNKFYASDMVYIYLKKSNKN